MRIAVIGPDSEFRREIGRALESEGHETVFIEEASEAPGRFGESGTDLAVVGGFESKEEEIQAIRALRARESLRRLPVLEVRPGSAAEDVVEFLDAGADDCVVKPFNARIVLARVSALLRRRIRNGALKPTSDGALAAGDLSIDLFERAVSVRGEEVSLSRAEFDLLSHLVRNNGNAIERPKLLDAVACCPSRSEIRIVDGLIGSLRGKLGAMGRCIAAVEGGYCFSAPPAYSFEEGAGADTILEKREWAWR